MFHQRMRTFALCESSVISDGRMLDTRLSMSIDLHISTCRSRREFGANPSRGFRNVCTALHQMLPPRLAPIAALLRGKLLAVRLIGIAHRAWEFGIGTLTREFTSAARDTIGVTGTSNCCVVIHSIVVFARIEHIAHQIIQHLLLRRTRCKIHVQIIMTMTNFIA